MSEASECAELNNELTNGNDIINKEICKKVQPKLSNNLIRSDEETKKRIQKVQKKLHVCYPKLSKKV